MAISVFISFLKQMEIKKQNRNSYWKKQIKKQKKQKNAKKKIKKQKVTTDIKN
jgi:hypothetical protein